MKFLRLVTISAIAKKTSDKGQAPHLHLKLPRKENGTEGLKLGGNIYGAGTAE